MSESGRPKKDIRSEERIPTQEGLLNGTITIPNGWWASTLHPVSAAREYKRSTGSTVSQAFASLLRYGVMFGLLVAALAAFALAITTLVGFTLPSKVSEKLALIVPTWLNAALLIFIILELANTVSEQIQEQRLSRKLVCDLVAVGVLSSVRHLLFVGAELTNQNAFVQRAAAGVTVDRTPVILELAVSAAIILVLVVAWRIAGGSLGQDNSAET